MEITTSSNAFLSLGSNLGDRLANLESAIAQIEQKVGTVFSRSSIYETPPWGFESEFTFLNMCIGVGTPFPVREILQITQKIELDLGRVANNSDGYSSRTIDIDIVLFGSEIIQEEHLYIPHPHYKSRRFVLAPLSEIAGDIIDPITHLTVAQLLVNCPDNSVLHRYLKEL